MRKRLAILIITCAIPCMITATYAAEKIRYNGSSTILKAIMYDASKEFGELEGVKFDLKGKSTGFGIKKLLAGECDIAGGGRPLKAEEKDKGLVETKVFIDAYAFIVNKKNPIKEISSQQISAILKGEIVKWDDLGGLAGKGIVVLSPPEKSAHFKNAKKIIGFSSLPKNSIKADMTPNVYKKVKSFPVSIGWLSSANVKGKTDVTILNIKHNGELVEINQSNVESGAYPYQQSMYLYTMGEPTGDAAKFIEYLKSSKGEAIITKAGFFTSK